MTKAMAHSDPQFLKGIEYFNGGKFFEAHEVWEDLWHQEHAEAKQFIQGLIQAATALHHFGNGNLKGARLLYDSGLALLQPYPDSFWGINSARLKADMTRCFEKLLSKPGDQLPGRMNTAPREIVLEEQKIPKILKSVVSAQ